MRHVSAGRAPVGTIPVRQSLAALTADLIRRAGGTGRWPSALPGERPLARELQISRSTLRAALRQLVRDRTLARRHGRLYVATPHVSRRSGAGSDLVALLSWGDDHRFPFSRILDMEELHAVLRGAGLQLQIVAQTPLASPRRMVARLQEHQARLHPCCWILFSCPPEIHAWFQQQGIPAIVSGSRRADIALPCVDLDNFAMARHAVGKLLALGHRRIGLLVPDRNLQGDFAAEAGFRAACAAHRPDPLDFTVLRHDRSPTQLTEAISQFARTASHPSALVVTHYWYAITTLTWLQRNGYRVPEDISLICLRADRDLDYAVPPIAGYTSDVRQHARRLARLAIRFARTGDLRAESILLLGHERPGGSLATGAAAISKDMHVYEEKR